MKLWLAGGAAVALAAALMTVETAPERPGAPHRLDGKPIRVEVLNGSTVNGAGLALAEDLREKGFDVVAIRNAESFDFAQTLVIDRVGVLDYAAAVARRIGGLEPRSEPDESLLLEVTVILGRDYAGRYGEEL